MLQELVELSENLQFYEKKERELRPQCLHLQEVYEAGEAYKDITSAEPLVFPEVAKKKNLISELSRTRKDKQER